MPQWTWAFNIVTLSQLLRTQPFFLTSASSPAEENNVAGDTAPELAVDISAVSVFDLVLAAPFKGLSQIFVVESALSGLGVAAAIGSYSPTLALHAVMGSTIGSWTGLLCGPPAADVAAGLWGFNSALTSMGIAVFMVYSTPDKTLSNEASTDDKGLLAFSAGGAIASACTFGALQKVFGTALGAPCLTLPFCITMSGCYFLAGRLPGLALAESPHSPEQNKPRS